MSLLQITPLQIIVILFSIFAWSRAGLRLWKKESRPYEFVFWTFIWIAVLIFSIWPALSTWISQYFGVERGVDLLIYLSIIMLFYLIFRMYASMENQQQQLTKLVRTFAIQNPKRGKTKK